MTVEELTGYLREQWPRLREELLRGEYCPQPVKEVEIPKAGGGIRRLGIPTVAGSIYPAGDPAGARSHLRSDVL